MGEIRTPQETISYGIPIQEEDSEISTQIEEG